MNNYERIKRFTPIYYQDITEMNAIYTVDGQMLDQLDCHINEVKSNMHICTADDFTITKLEEFIGIKTDVQKSLDERRGMVNSYFIGFGKISKTKIKDIIYSFTGAGCTIELKPCNTSNDNALYITIIRGESEYFNIQDIKTILSNRIPGHIMIIYYLALNQNNLNSYTHAQLHSFTYNQLKKGVPLEEAM